MTSSPTEIHAPLGGRVKRIMDLVIAIPMTVLTAPQIVIAISCVATHRDWLPPDPAWLNGRPFTVLKFRTMVQGAEGWVGLAVDADDERITCLGARNEVLARRAPQLINVLLGQMSIVGPRPTVPSQIERYTEEQRGRLLARPGLTGLAQIRGRATLPWSERIAIDLEYVRTWSPLGDLRIMLGTIGVLLRPTDTYRGETGGFDLPAPDETNEETPPSPT